MEHDSQLDSFYRTGIGNISAIRGVPEPCEWVCSQARDGEIELVCRMNAGAIKRLYDHGKLDSNSHAFEISDLTFTDIGPRDQSLDIGGQRSAYNLRNDELTFYPSNVSCHFTFGRPLSHMIFRLVNLEIVVVPHITIDLPCKISVDGAFVPLKLPNGDAWIHPLENHSRLIDQLKHDGGVSVTCELLLPISHSGDIDSAIETVDQLCSVLTLLSGNRVNWLSYSMVDLEGNESVAARASVTRPYQRQTLLNTLSDHRQFWTIQSSGYAPIIDRMMEKFAVAKREWNLPLVINNFHEALSSDHFIEQRALLLANCMEMLRQAYVDRKDDAFIIDGAAFSAKEKILRSDLKKILESHFPPEEGMTDAQRKIHRKKLHEMTTHTSGLNRYGFKHILLEMAKELGLFTQSSYKSLNSLNEQGYRAPLRLDATEEEINSSTSSENIKDLQTAIRTFVSIRDNLIHQSKFLVPETAVIATRQDLTDIRWEQLRFMERFVAAFIATILGWHQPLPSPKNAL